MNSYLMRLAELANTKVIANEFDRMCNLCDVDKKEKVLLHVAKKMYQDTYKSIQKYLKINVKVQSKFRAYISDVEKAMETFKTNGTLEHFEKIGNDYAINQMNSTKHVGSIMVHIQSGRTKLFKKVVKCLNRLILNIRKVINV